MNGLKFFAYCIFMGLYLLAGIFFVALPFAIWSLSSWIYFRVGDYLFLKSGEGAVLHFERGLKLFLGVYKHD